MEKTNIRRSLFIGLGGTGMRTLLYLKKMFVDTYDEVPPMIGFLGVDTDTNEFSDTLDSRSFNSPVGVMEDSNTEMYLYEKGKDLKSGIIRLNPDEQLQIYVNNPRELYGRQKEIFDQWLPKENNHALQSLRQGAGQVRTNGRFAIVANTSVVEKKVRDALNKIASIKSVDNTNYDLIDTKTDVYVIFSLGGGTGCGTFIDMAYTLRRCAKDCILVAYALLPTVFRTQYHTAMDKVMPNGYGAIKDLDWLMSRDWDDKEICLPLDKGATWTTNQSPFDVCMLIDNKNQNQDVYTDNKQLEEMIALSLVTSVGETSKINKSVFDNISVLAHSGSYDIAHKKAWATGLGVCEAVVNVEELRKIYAHNVTINLVDQLLQTPEGIDYEVMNWIDSPQVKIREHDADDVIDFLLSKTFPPMPALDKDDYVNAHEVALQYIATQQPSKESLDAKLEELRSRVRGQLRLFVIKLLNRKSGGGVGAAEAALNTLLTQVKIYLGEMIEEKEEFEKTIPIHQSELLSISNDLKNEAGSFFRFIKLSTSLHDLAESVTSIATEIAAKQRGIARREKAISFYKDFLVSLEDYSALVKGIKEKMSKVKDSSVSSKAKITTRIDQLTETFQYNLTRRVLSQTVPKTGEFLFADFIDSLTGNCIYDFNDMDSNGVWKGFVQFAYNLPRARELGKMNINAVIDSMSNEDFDELVRKMVAKSSPLLPCDYHGYQNDSPDVSYYIGTKDFKNNRFYKDDYFKQNVRGAVDVTFSDIGMADRMIIFSQMTPIPPFAISSMDICEAEYNDTNQTTNFHFDKRIQNEMIRKGYSLTPSDNCDNALELWVRAFIFGMVKNENGIYKYVDKDNGDSLSDYWMELAEDRDEAFGRFKNKLGLLAGQYERKLKRIETDNGSSFVANILKDAKEHYYEKYSGIGLTKQELRSDKHLKGVADQIRAEIAYMESIEI